MKEYVDRLKVAQNHLDWASSPEEVDIAIYELNAAERALDHYIEIVGKEKKNEVL